VHSVDQRLNLRHLCEPCTSEILRNAETLRSKGCVETRDRQLIDVGRAYGLSTLETIVADFGDNLSPKTATVAEFRRFWRQSPNWATIVVSVDRPLDNVPGCGS